MLVALGAILYWAVSAEAEGVDINLVGLILLIVGIIGLILTLFLTAGASDTDKKDITVIER